MRHFQSVSAAEFAAVVRDFPWTRRISEVHLHHTWRPRQQDYSGRRTIEGMWRSHTQDNGWSDIAQHVSVAPDGTIWIGRNFNWSPASAKGFNGNASAGPFMIEMIGDFDFGREKITPEQKQATLAVIKAVQEKFGLSSERLRFHNEMSSKSCPGETQKKADWIAEVAAFQPPAAPRDKARAAFPNAAPQSLAIIASMNPGAEQTDDDDMARAEHEVGYGSIDSRSPQVGRGAEPRGLDPQMLEALAEHIVNLTQGRFSTGGTVQTSAGDVDRILDERLAAEVERAKAAGGKARLLLYAHGGLVSERSALLGAFDQLKFWRANHVYPLFFIWETGFAETLKQLIFRARAIEAAPRGPVREWMDDRVEDVVRTLGGEKIWSGMKRSAELASRPGGGAAYVAEKLPALLARHGDALEIHIGGHSAGSIFMTNLVSGLADGAKVRSAHFLAPAISSSGFKRGFVPELGGTVEKLTLYTMTKVRELADTVTPLYGKSLLYMIYHVLEAKRDTDILGLESSLRRDSDLRSVFGLDGGGDRRAEIIWSPSSDRESGSASNSTSHGGFDNDAATLESICRRVLGKTNGEPISPYRASRSFAASAWDQDVEWPEHLRPYMASQAVPPAAQPEPVTQAAAAPLRAPQGRRRALCIGIDNYRHITPLAGCVNDMRSWSRALEALGFEVETMKEDDATADAILSRLRGFIGSGRTGDRLVVQFAGHGTQFDDATGDETDRKDSALCAVDCGASSGRGGLVLDDDIFEALKLLPAGASITAFIDCCHSGTMTRALGAPPVGTLPADARPRFVRPTAEMLEAYDRLKEEKARSASTGSRSLSGEEGLIGVQFSACQDSEVAFEFNGAGHFTSIATKLLPQAQGLTNRTFHDRLIAEFGTGRRQTPSLYCEPSAFDQPLNLF